MASSDEEYLPSDLDEEAYLQQAYGTDEEGYLQGATTGGNRGCCRPAARRRQLPQAPTAAGGAGGGTGHRLPCA